VKPFDLEAAKRGEKLVTRDGREVTEFKYFETEATDSPCCAIIGGAAMWLHTDGTATGEAERTKPYDLFMAPKKRTVYTNLYAVANKAGDRSPGWHAVWHNTEEAARKCAGLGAVAVAAPVEIEE
jgi:hypothetical protein